MFGNSNKNDKEIWDKNYPVFKILKEDFHKYPLLKKLLEIPDCPTQILYRGNFEKFNDPNMKFLTVIGSRAITNYGRDAVKFLLEGLQGYNVCIISGLALGGDSEAHKNALKNSLPVIAVPGSGISPKVLYPRTNLNLAEEILKNDGLLMNEFEEDFVSTLWSFPKRNRIKAAISNAVLLVEAGEKSGTLITARLATEYNKDVLCVPGQIFSNTSYGTNFLISQGARIVTKAEDILDELHIKIKLKEEDAQKKFEKLNLSKDEITILENLNEEKTKDKLKEVCNLDISDFLMALTLLEMKNLVKEDVGTIRRVY